MSSCNRTCFRRAFIFNLKKIYLSAVTFRSLSLFSSFFLPSFSASPPRARGGWGGRVTLRYPLALCVLPALLAFVPRSFSSAPAKPPPLPPPLLCSRPLGPQPRTPRDPRAPRPARSGLSTRGRGSAPAGRPPPPVPASPGAEARRGARRVPAPAPHPAQPPFLVRFRCEAARPGSAPEG